MRLQDVQLLRSPRQKGSSVNVPPQSRAGGAGSGQGWGNFRWPQMGEFGWPPGQKPQRLLEQRIATHGPASATPKVESSFADRSKQQYFPIIRRKHGIVASRRQKPLLVRIRRTI